MNIDDELIAKYLANEATAEERQEVEAWLQISQVNQHHFSQIRKLWEQTEGMTSHEEANVDIDRAWNHFKSKATAKDPGYQDSGRALKKNFLPWLVRMAAVLVVGFAIYLIYQNSVTMLVEETVLTASDEAKAKTLPDGSLIAINAKSKVVYPENFSGDVRAVSLEGEAFFEVKSNPDKPFLVKAKGATITVLGTSFYVKAYDSLNTIEVGVEEGTVKVATDRANAVLTAGERISIDMASGQIADVKAYNPNHIFWKSQTLIFQNEPLADVFKTLEKVYNITIEVRNPQILNCKLSGKFYRESADQIIEIIDVNFNITSKREADRFIIYGNGCD